MTTGQAIWVGMGMFFGLIAAVVVAGLIDRKFGAGQGTVYVFILGGAFLGWVATKLFRIK